MSGPSFRILQPWSGRQALKYMSSTKRGPWRMVIGKKLQAASKKLQAASDKRQALIASSHKL